MAVVGADGLRKALVAVSLALYLAPVAAAGPPARLDPSLAGRGLLFTPTDPASPSPAGSRVAQDPHGRLVTLTSAADELVVARHLPGGRLDPSFGRQGVAHVPLSRGAATRADDEATAGALALQPDGRILIGGSYDPDVIVEGGSGAAKLAIARLRPDGGVDRSFGGDAQREAPAGALLERRGTTLLAIALQGSRILVGGEAEAGPAYVARYTGRGRLDRSFGRGTGMAHFARRQARGAVTALLARPGGDLYAAGYLGADFLLARLGRDGIPDRGFGRGGRVLTDVTGRPGCGCSLAQGLARDRHGRLLVSGTILAHRPAGYREPEVVARGRRIALARYRPSGALDRGFGNNGIVRTAIGRRAYGRGLALQRDGRIVVAGSAAKRGGESRFTVLRYRPNGGLDPSFFGDGVFARSLGTGASEAWDPLVDRGGRIVVAGDAVAGTAPRASGVLLARFLAGR